MLLPPVLASLLPTLAVTLSRNQAIVASVVVILVVIIAWKFLKLAFKIALVVVAAILIYLALQWAGIL